MKKWTISLLASALLVLPATSVPSAAAAVPNSATINNGQINNGRVLVPLRAVSEHLGASLQWFQSDKVVKIINGDTTIWLAANFKRVIIDKPPAPDNPDIPQREYVDLEAATQVIKGTTYVPLRFVSQSLGANVTVQISDHQKITESRLNVLSGKLNQAADVSSIKNVNSTFKPYFTDRLIKSIIQNKGLSTVDTYEAPVSSPIYISKTSASLSQSVILANGLTGEDQYVEDRNITLVFTDGVWKVDSVSMKARLLISGFADYHPE